MILTISDVLGPEVAARLGSMVLGAEVSEAATIVLESIRVHPLLLLGVQPKSLSRPIFRRYDEGMELSNAVDDAMVEGSGGIRADVGLTVFLSDPSSYDGGELVIDTGYGDESYKERPGGCIVRPASARYRVARVTRGTRWTAEVWAQSMVRNPAQREIVYDVGYSLHLLELFAGGTRTAELDRLRNCQQNLLRLWAEP